MSKVETDRSKRGGIGKEQEEGASGRGKEGPKTDEKKELNALAISQGLHTFTSLNLNLRGGAACFRLRTNYQNLRLLSLQAKREFT